MTIRKKWARDELILAFNLYCKTPFGRLHKTNPDIILLASKLERTPSSIAMKLSNFASLDPAQKARNIKGLANASLDDRKIWDEFRSDWSGMAYESQKAFQSLTKDANAEVSDETDGKIHRSLEITEEIRSVRVRLIQGFFRDSVLASYGGQCALCRLSITELLVAGHIIPWSDNIERRADPTNGISLCALHDRAFDRGFIAIDRGYKVMVSSRIKVKSPSQLHKIGLMDMDGEKMHLPSRFMPDESALAYHRETIFRP